VVKKFQATLGAGEGLALFVEVPFARARRA
jgi:hypothetical protein